MTSEEAQLALIQATLYFKQHYVPKFLQKNKGSLRSKSKQKQAITGFLKRHRITHWDWRSFRTVLDDNARRCGMSHGDDVQSISRFLDVDFSEIPQHVLQFAKYNPTTFSGRDLRLHAPKAERGLHAKRSVIYALEDIDHHKHLSGTDSDKYGNTKARAASLQALIQKHNLMTDRNGATSAIPLNSDTLRTRLTDIWNKKQAKPGKPPGGLDKLWSTETEHISTKFLTSARAARAHLEPPLHSESSSDLSADQESLSTHDNGQQDGTLPWISPYRKPEGETASSAMLQAVASMTPDVEEQEDLVEVLMLLNSQPPSVLESPHSIAKVIGCTDPDGALHLRTSTGIKRLAHHDNVELARPAKRHKSSSDPRSPNTLCESTLEAKDDTSCTKWQDLSGHDIARTVERLHSRLRNAIRVVFDQIGLAIVHCSPCIRDPPEQLARLVSQSLGNDWMDIEDELKQKNRLKGYDMALSISSGFLFSAIYSQPAPWVREIESAAFLFEQELDTFCKVKGN